VPDFIDLDALVSKRVTFGKLVGGVMRKWEIKDDMPDTVALAVMAAGEHAEARTRELAEDQEMSAEERGKEVLKLRAAFSEEMLDAFTEFWQVSYPEDGREELARRFTHKERQAILEYFFTLQSNELLERLNALTTASTPAAASDERPNRAARRQSGNKTNGSGAIPSQKHIKRALGGL